MGLRYERYELVPQGTNQWAVVGVGSDGLRKELLDVDDQEQGAETVRLLEKTKDAHGIVEQLRLLVWQIKKQPVTNPNIPADPALLADINRLLRDLEGMVL